MSLRQSVRLLACIIVVAQFGTVPRARGGPLSFGPEQIVQANGANLTVSGYSVPYYADWNDDGRNDLIVGEGGSGSDGRVRVYLNGGTSSEPQFSDYEYVQSMGADLVVGARGCLGVFPRLTDYNGDNKKDLLLGLSDGTFQAYLNTGTDAMPTFDAGTFIDYGPAGSKVPMDVGDRGTLALVDWDNDGLEDFVTGALDGKIRVYLNEGAPGNPDFLTETILPDGSGLLQIPGDRSSPVVVDLDGDDKKDLLVGNTLGEILFYPNLGTDASPVFSDYSYVAADGVKIDLPNLPRSRPTVTDWTGDGLLDLLVGSGDGMVRLFEGVTPLQPGDANQDLRFDQLDLIQVLQARKYGTGQPATWGEGDWDGAPGGTPGNPPQGDGRFDQFDVVAALSAAIYLTGPYAATAAESVVFPASDESLAMLISPVSAGLGDGALSEPGVASVATPEPSGWVIALLGMAALAALGPPRRT